MEKLDKLIERIKALPDTDRCEELFQENPPKNDKNICLHFFEGSVKKFLPNEELEKMLEQVDLDGNYYELYRLLNGPTHPIRNWLIVQSIVHTFPIRGKK